MRKFFLILFLQIIFVLGIFPSNFSNAWAANDCKFNVTSNPSPPLPVDQKTIELTIDATGVLVEGTPYLVTVGGKPVRTQGALSVQSGANFPFRVSGGKITIPNLAESGEISLITNFMSPWKSKLYKVSAYDNAGISETNKICSGNLDLTGAPGSTQPGVCSIDFTNTSWTPNDDVKIIVNNLPGNPGDGHRIIIRRGARFGTPVKDWCEDLLKEANLKKHEPGNYYVEITDKCQGFGFLGTIDENAACGYLFAITKDGKGGGPISEVPVATPKPLPPPCSEWVDENGKPTGAPDPTNTDYDTGVKCSMVKTAIGDFNTEPQKFVPKLLGIVLSLSGGIALLLIIMAGYKMMASQGNPEKLQGAKESLTSAIIGLIFIIFSFIIIQLIGADILRIPGFK